MYSRRWFLATAVAGVAAAAAPPSLRAGAATARVAPGLLRRALEALQQHRDRIEYQDVMAIADFSLPSHSPRLHLLSLADGSVTSHWVAHGRGSDPAHTGWLEHFSNEVHSNATSAGAYRTEDIYSGAHGRSMRLEGLDPTNSNAASRAIVVHGAWYVSAAIIGQWGMLGRSEGCFAVSHTSLEEILVRLPRGRLIYADRV
jgi:L,D-transpeptidase catalytic domain